MELEDDTGSEDNPPPVPDSINSGGNYKPSIYNLSSRTLSSAEMTLLRHGPKFTPTPLMTNKIDYSADMSDLSRKVNLAVSLCNANYKDNGSLIKLKNNKAGTYQMTKTFVFSAHNFKTFSLLKLKVPVSPKATCHRTIILHLRTLIT